VINLVLLSIKALFYALSNFYFFKVKFIEMKKKIMAENLQLLMNKMKQTPICNIT